MIGNSAKDMELPVGRYVFVVERVYCARAGAEEDGVGLDFHGGEGFSAAFGGCRFVPL